MLFLVFSSISLSSSLKTYAKVKNLSVKESTPVSFFEINRICRGTLQIGLHQLVVGHQLAVGNNEELVK